jgi:hypothetical protein
MKSRPWYVRKRVLLPLLTLGLVGLAANYAISTSNTSRIVLYNQTGEPLPPLKLTVCGQTKVLGSLPADASIRWDLMQSGAPSAIELEFGVAPPLFWQGGFVEPRGGYRITLHVWSTSRVEVHSQISFWQRLLGRKDDVTE